MFRRTMLYALAVLTITSFAPAAASAAGWSVYIYNTRRPQNGVYRAGDSYYYGRQRIQGDCAILRNLQ